MCWGLWSSTVRVQKSPGGKPSVSEPPGARFSQTPGNTDRPAAKIPHRASRQRTSARLPIRIQLSHEPITRSASCNPTAGWITAAGASKIGACHHPCRGWPTTDARASQPSARAMSRSSTMASNR